MPGTIKTYLQELKTKYADASMNNRRAEVSRLKTEITFAEELQKLYGTDNEELTDEQFETLKKSIHDRAQAYGDMGHDASRVRDVILKFDADGDGKISRKEIKALFSDNIKKQKDEDAEAGLPTPTADNRLIYNIYTPDGQLNLTPVTDKDGNIVSWNYETVDVKGRSKVITRLKPGEETVIKNADGSENIHRAPGKDEYSWDKRHKKLVKKDPKVGKSKRITNDILRGTNKVTVNSAVVATGNKKLNKQIEKRAEKDILEAIKNGKITTEGVKIQVGPDAENENHYVKVMFDPDELKNYQLRKRDKWIAKHAVEDLKPKTEKKMLEMQKMPE